MPIHKHSLHFPAEMAVKYQQGLLLFTQILVMGQIID